MASKPILCRLGRHKWRTQMNEDRKAFSVCERCNKTQDKWSYSSSPGAMPGG
ncbi:MAG: DUF1660 family phage protein [Nocardioidaceae bacterium]